MQEKARGLLVNDPACGMNSLVLLAKWDRDSLSWKTSQRSLLVELETFAERFPISGIMRNGELFELPTLALRTDENGSSLWPTPDAQMAKHAAPTQWEIKRAQSDPTRQRQLHIETGGKLNPFWVEALMGFPIGWTDGPPDQAKRSTNGKRHARVKKRKTAPQSSER
jgi:hypothetical protein